MCWANCKAICIKVIGKVFSFPAEGNFWGTMLLLARKIAVTISKVSDHPWLTEIPAPDGGPGSDVTS